MIDSFSANESTRFSYIPVKIVNIKCNLLFYTDVILFMCVNLLINIIKIESNTILVKILQKIYWCMSMGENFSLSISSCVFELRDFCCICPLVLETAPVTLAYCFVHSCV